MKGTIKEDLARLTLEEKCWLLGQKDGSFGRTESVGRVGNVPLDNPRGGADYFRSGYGVNDGQYHPVAFPTNACLAMSWDTALAEESGRVMAREGLANPEKVTWIFRPGVNIKRSPLCGRNFEYFSEDPVCAGEMAGSYIIGMQDEGVAETLKHYVCNNQEFERMTTNAVVGQRALREIYAKPFGIAIQKGHPKAVMTSYNRVNGEWVNSSPEVMDILRKDFGYDGVVISDFGAIHHNKVQAHACGMDIELAPDGIHVQELIEAVRSGEISEDVIDEELGRVLSLCDSLEDIPACELDMDALHEEAQEAAEQCLVLLQNDGILPLSPEMAARDLLVVGSLAVNPSYYGGGSGHMNGYLIDRPLDEIRKIAGDEVAFAKGYETKGGWPPADTADESLIREALDAASRAKVVIFFAGLEYCYESEGYDRADIQLPESQRLLLNQLLERECRVVIVASSGSVLDLAPYADRAAAVIYSGLAGEGFGGALARILFGFAEPGGRLSETFPLREEDTPAYLSFTRDCRDGVDVDYGEGIYVGYRWYDAKGMEVLYPFGYGLSYTQFEISDLAVDRETFTKEGTLTVSLKVKNVGARAGSEVVQIYVRDVESLAPRPVKELKAFAKVRLQPGEEQTVTVQLHKDAFSYYSERMDSWVAESGDFEIMAGTSSRDIVMTKTITLTGGDRAFVYDRMTPLAWFVKEPKFLEIVKQEMPDQYVFFRQETFEWLCLVLPLPFYKMSEPYLGFPILTEEQVEYLLMRMNE